MLKTQIISLTIGSMLGGAIVQVAVTACGKVSATTSDARTGDAHSGDARAEAPPANASTGTVTGFAGQTAPSGWLLCDGSPVSRVDYAPLFAVIGTIYGEGDQVNTFNLPDLRGRTIIGTGGGTGLSMRTLGQKGGEEQHTLTVAEMPAHTHREQGSNRLDGANGGGIHYQDVDNISFAPVTTASTGGNLPHNTMSPFISLNYIVKI